MLLLVGLDTRHRKANAGFWKHRMKAIACTSIIKYILSTWNIPVPKETASRSPLWFFFSMAESTTREELQLAPNLGQKQCSSMYCGLSAYICTTKLKLHLTCLIPPAKIKFTLQFFFSLTLKPQNNYRENLS